MNTYRTQMEDGQSMELSRFQLLVTVTEKNKQLQNVGKSIISYSTSSPLCCIVLNKCSLRRDRHPAGVKEPKGGK